MITLSFQIVMKAFIVIALLCLGGTQASLLDDLAAATTAALDGILTTAQTAAQGDLFRLFIIRTSGKG